MDPTDRDALGLAWLAHKGKAARTGRGGPRRRGWQREVGILDQLIVSFWIPSVLVILGSE